MSDLPIHLLLSQVGFRVTNQFQLSVVLQLQAGYLIHEIDFPNAPGVGIHTVIFLQVLNSVTPRFRDSSTCSEYRNG